MIHMISCVFFPTCARELVFVEAFLHVQCERVISEGLQHPSRPVAGCVRPGHPPPEPIFLPAPGLKFKYSCMDA